MAPILIWVAELPLALIGELCLMPTGDTTGRALAVKRPPTARAGLRASGHHSPYAMPTIQAAAYMVTAEPSPLVTCAVTRTTNGTGQGNVSWHSQMSVFAALWL